MDIQIPREQQTVIEGLVASGRYKSVQEAVAEGIRLLVSNEKLRQAVQIGIDQAQCGELHAHDTVFEHLKAMAQEPDNNG